LLSYGFIDAASSYPTFQEGATPQKKNCDKRMGEYGSLSACG